ncbi:MAG: DNA-3-methyladenine glycosylase [Opitutaceae bacterium]|nr:DNA-3-methyladenine glycosylase [Opitutaceae bacterium]
MSQILSPTTFSSEDTVALARRLLGCELVMRDGEGQVIRRTIVETEAYHGPDDLASHASRGRTPRNRPMFGPAGHWYVYLCYGIHEMLNLVTGPRDFPAAILIRGVAGAVGPGKLTRSLGIDRRFNGLAAQPDTGLWLEEGEAVSGIRILETTRVGVDYAGPVWAAKPWRFVLVSAAVRSPYTQRQSPLRGVQVAPLPRRKAK